MKYSDDTVLTLTYGMLMDILKEIQYDAFDADRTPDIYFDNLNKYIDKEIDIYKTIQVVNNNE